MTTLEDIAVRTIREIREVWQVDTDRSQPFGDRGDLHGSGFGFDWWPGDFKVEVRVEADGEDRKDETCRLSVSTDLLSGVDITRPKVLQGLADINRLGPSFAVVTYPAELVKEKSIDPVSADVWLDSVVYVRAGLPWLPRFFASETILQPIDAQYRAEAAAEMLGGRPNRSRPDRHESRCRGRACDNRRAVSCEGCQHARQASPQRRARDASPRDGEASRISTEAVIRVNILASKLKPVFKSATGD